MSSGAVKLGLRALAVFLVRIPCLGLGWLWVALSLLCLPASAGQIGDQCPNGVDRLVRTLYENDRRDGFWNNGLSRSGHLFQEDLYRKLLAVSTEHHRMKAMGYALIDVDVFSGTQWGTKEIKSLHCKDSKQEPIAVDLVIISGYGHRQFDFPVVVFVERDRLSRLGWRVGDIGSYKDSETGEYGYRLSEGLDSWLKSAAELR